MPKVISRAEYEQAIAYFREHPGDSAGCAKHMGWHYRTARKMWTRDSKLWPWMRAIETVLAEEKALELTEQEEQEQEQRLSAQREVEKAERIAEQALRFEEQALGAARADVAMGLASLAKLTKGINTLVEKVGHQLESGVDHRGKPINVDVGKALGYIRAYTTSVKGLVGATETLVNLGRVQRNLPTAIVGLEARSLTLEQAKHEVEQAQRAVRRAEVLQARGKLPPPIDVHGESVE